MKASFQEARYIVLSAAFEALYSHSDYEEYKAEEIRTLIADAFSLGYTRRILAHLAKDGLVVISNYENSENYYSLTDDGIVIAEKLSPLPFLKARFTQALFDESLEVPASDRIVHLNHNEIVEAQAPIDELLDALEKDNGDPDQPGLRERLIGQIKAGRELIRSGEYRAYLLYELLVRALSEILSRYGNSTITALANALLGAVVSKLFESE